jgi:hypothetical protein
MRSRKIVLAGLAAVLLAGCAGYHLGPLNGAAAGAKSIEVQPFHNQTLEPRLGDAITQSVRERLQTDGSYRLVTRGNAGDVVTPENFRVDLLVHVIARDRLSGRLLLDQDVKGHTFVHIGNDLASAERQALPVLAEDLAQNITDLLTAGTW